MGFIKNTIGETNMENFKLAEITTPGKQISSQGTIKVQKPLVPFADLEMAYKSDEISFNAINKSVQMIMAGGFKGFIHEKKKIVTQYTEFFEEIGEIGEDTTTLELMESIFQDQMVYGNSYVEKIFNEDDTKIVDLTMIDPKRIDYAKTADGKIILDINGKPIGYMIKFDYGNVAIGDEVPKEYGSLVTKESNTIFILAKRICHFKLYTIGDKFYGVGLIEPAYKSGIYKKNIEKGQANSVYARGFSPMVAYVGNDRRMATPSDIQGVLDKIRKLNYQQYDAFPDWVKIESVKLNETSMAQSALKDMRTNQIAALSAPQALVSGSGEATNRATLSDQRILWEFTLKDIIKRTMSYFRKYILKPLNEYNSYGGVPNVEWGELRAEDINITSDKIIRLLTAKNLHVSKEFRNDVEEDLRKVMNIKKSVDANKKKVLISENNNGKNNDGSPDIQLPKPTDKPKPQTD